MPVLGLDLEEAAASITGRLAERRRANDVSRRLGDDTVAALESAGQFRTFVPARFGGIESRLLPAVRACAALAGADPAAAWVVMALGRADLLLGRFDDRARTEVFGAGPDTGVCSVPAPAGRSVPVDGGLRVTGHWTPASGCRHARWAVVGVPDAGDPAAEFGDRPEPGLALIPMSDLDVLPTWRTTGIRATAGDTLVATDVLVPGHRVLPTSAVLDGVGAPPDRNLLRPHPAPVPAISVFTTAPFLGMADSALRTVLAAGPDPVTAPAAAFRLEVARAATAIDSSWALVARAATEIETAAEQGRVPDRAELARHRGWTGHVIAELRDAVRRLRSAHGGAAIPEDGVLEATFRDMETAARQPAADPAAGAEVHGCGLLGAAPAAGLLA